MQWSRIGLSTILMIGSLSLASVASADTVASTDQGEDYSYNGMVIQPIPAGPYGVSGRYGMVEPGYYRGCHRIRYHHGMRHHYVCPMHQAFYVCQKYTYEITPQHRDVACTKWKVEWKRVHHWRRYHEYK